MVFRRYEKQRFSKAWMKILFVLFLIVLLFSLREIIPQQRHDRDQEWPVEMRFDSDIDARGLAERLDQRFLSRLVSPANQADMSQPHQALHGERPAASKYTATLVIGRMASEADRLHWTEKLHNVQDQQIYIVDDNSTTGPHLDINHGREAAVYMKYIVENYHKLPDISFFWHTDEVVWHNNLLMGWSSVEEINRMDRENIMRQGYVPSRCDHWPGCPSWITFNPSKAEHRLDPHRLGDLFNSEVFSTIFPDIDQFPLYLAGTCCSQFAVSRDQIHSRPKATYERLLRWAVEYPDDAQSGRVFEYAWPFIFTGRGSMCPSMRECYCKTYNFCIEDQNDVADLENWNALRTRREEVQWQLTFFKDALETEVRERRALGATNDDIEAVQASFASELQKLNKSLEYLIPATWQAREEIIAYWRLPPPPVGW